VVAAALPGKTARLPLPFRAAALARSPSPAARVDTNELLPGCLHACIYVSLVERHLQVRKTPDSRGYLPSGRHG